MILEALKMELSIRKEQGQDIAQLPEIIKHIETLQSQLDSALSEIERLKVRNQHLGHDLDMTHGKLIEKTLDYNSSKNRNAEYFEKIQSLEATIGRQAPG